jgi:predicted tellurium resistance membrane protein TerC
LEGSSTLFQLHFFSRILSTVEYRVARMQYFEGLFTLHSLFTLVMLILLQAVLGIDNLLYISIESKRVEEDKQSLVRKWGIGLAIGMRLLLLLVIMFVIDSLSAPFLAVHVEGFFEADVNVHAFIVLAGGVFVIYTAVKEIYHMLSVDNLGEHAHEKPKRSFGAAVMWIVLMNLVFSFDSIISSIALTKQFVVMATAIVISGLLMIWMSDHVSRFLQKNRMYEVLGLFILFIVGVMLLAEGGHLAHLSFFGHKIEKMATSTFYFVIAVLVIVDVVQSRYQRKLLAEQTSRSNP